MVKPPNKPFSTRLPENVRASLRLRAESMGLTESDLGRLFIIEKLNETPRGKKSEARTLAALIIAALSETIDFDDAKALVQQHLETEVPS